MEVDSYQAVVWGGYEVKKFPLKTGAVGAHMQADTIVTNREERLMGKKGEAKEWSFWVGKKGEIQTLNGGTNLW